jgi:hypothetical protein
MRFIFTSLIVLFYSFVCISQKVSNIDYDEIKINTTDSISEFYYPTLIKRFLENDTTLTPEDYKYFYYGNVFTDYYNPYGKSNSEIKFQELYNHEDFENAIPLGKITLKENPVNLKVIFNLLICYYVLENKDSTDVYARKYYSFLDVIYNSGNGKSASTAFVILKVNDEYQILADLGLRRTSQALLRGSVDRLKIDKKHQKKIKGQKKITELYFDVSMPLSHLIKQNKQSR